MDVVREKPSYRFKGSLPLALATLRARPQWICWDYVWDEPRQKWNKPPLSAHTGRKAAGGATNPVNWGTFEEAVATQQRLKLAGVGYVLTRDDNVTGVDIDHCISDSGTYSPTAATVLGYAETYAETSPSGEGVRLFILGKYAGGVIKKDAIGVEVYTDLRYLTVTGEQIEGSPNELREAPQTLAYLAHLAGVAEQQSAPKLRDRPLPRAGDSYFANVNASALQHLDDWVPTLHPRAKKQATGAWRVTSYDLNRNLEEDLSYHPTGIRDHGEECGLTAVDAVLRYGAAPSPVEAAMWLCQRMGMEPAALGWQGAQRAVSLIIRNKDEIRTAELDKPPLEFDDEIEIDPKVTALVKGLLHPGELAAIYGPSGVGKSFAAIDLAYHLAHGLEWHGRRVPSKAPVLVVALEGVRGVRHRMLAYAGFLGNAGKMLARLTIHALLDRSETGTAGEAAIIASTTELAKKAGQPVGLIIIDTLARAMAGDDENSTQDMNAFVTRVTAVARVTGAAVLVVHHTGKDDARGMRGSSTLFAACDLVLKIADMSGTKLVTAEKVKDGEVGKLFAYRLERKVLGYDDDKDEISSCIVSNADVRDAVPAEKLTPNQARMLAILQNAKRPMTSEEWNEASRKAGIGVTRRATLIELRNALLDKSLIYEGRNGWSVKT